MNFSGRKSYIVNSLQPEQLNLNQRPEFLYTFIHYMLCLATFGDVYKLMQSNAYQCVNIILFYGQVIYPVNQFVFTSEMTSFQNQLFVHFDISSLTDGYWILHIISRKTKLQRKRCSLYSEFTGPGESEWFTTNVKLDNMTVLRIFSEA